MESELLTTEGDVTSIIETVTKLNKARVVHVEDPDSSAQLPIVFAPSGVKLIDVKAELDKWLPAPRRLKGRAVAETLDGFIDLVKRHSTDRTAIFAVCGSTPSLTAIIDYHGPSIGGSAPDPSFCEHRVMYAFPKTAELLAWERASIGWQPQRDFAQFLDAQRFDLVDPLDAAIEPSSVAYDVMSRATPRDRRAEMRPEATYASPGDLAQLVETLTATTRTKWGEARTDRFGGVKVTTEKESKIEGEERIPSLFLVELAPFVGGEKLVLPARLRAMVDDGKLRLSAELIGLDRVIERGFAAALQKVAEATGRPIYRGSPEA